MWCVMSLDVKWDSSVWETAEGRLVCQLSVDVCVQANLALQEARLVVAQAELTTAQEQLDAKQRELDAVQVLARIPTELDSGEPL